MTLTPRAEPITVLYESATTRVLRARFAGADVVCKEPVGPDAGRRLRHEQDILSRLAGVEGVAQLATHALRDGMLALRDSGGVALSQMLEAGRCDIGMVLSLAPRIARALAALHRAGIIHRDINPANIVVRDDGELELIDFDLAMFAEQRATAAACAMPDGIAGTLGYLAPEQTGRTGRPVDQRADLYALGATLYELATGKLPFESQDTLEAIHDHLVRQPQAPSQVDPRVPPALSAIVLRLLAKAPEQRYEGLEQRVQARTRELEQTQAQLVAAARRAGKAEIANNVLHNVGNVLNSVNVSTSLVRRTVANSRFEGLTRLVALMNEHKDDLPAFIGGDTRGRAVLPYLSDLAAALRDERDSTLADLDRVALSVDHITNVVAAQQSHAGPSSVLETARPEELIEEAQHLGADTIARSNLTVLRRYEDVPPMPLDRPRMLQILVNLISNASQAMEGMPETSRQLTLASELVRDGSGGEHLRITVQDQGEGITADNLTRIFAHGFTTRSGGHGFGLHSSSLAAMEMGARLTAHSDGPGRGAAFVLELPVQSPP